MGGWVKPKVKTFRFYRVSDSNKASGFRAEGGGWFGGFEFARTVRVRGVYGFSSLVKQNKKAKICFVIYIAGKRKILFVYL